MDTPQYAAPQFGASQYGQPAYAQATTEQTANAVPSTPAPTPVPTQSQQPSLPPIDGVTPIEKPWLSVFASLAVIICFVATFILYFLNVSASSKIETLSVQIKESQDALANEPLASLERQVTQLATALTGYRTAVSQQLDYGLLDDELKKATLKEITFDSLSQDDKGVFRVSGRANDFVAVAKMLLAYRQSPFLSNADLEAVSLTERDEDKKVTFILVGNLKRTYLGSKSATGAAATPSTIPASQPAL
jgi:Tfp pilus assembly protein PilN